MRELKKFLNIKWSKKNNDDDEEEEEEWNGKEGWGFFFQGNSLRFFLPSYRLVRKLRKLSSEEK